MTDQRTPDDRPATEAGRRLWDWMRGDSVASNVPVPEDILAIEQEAALLDRLRVPLSEKWWRDGSMVVDGDGPLDDDQHYVADAATDDAAQRFVDWHNEALAFAAAHDRQPYPTAWAYEQACRVRDEWRDRALAAEAALAEPVSREPREPQP